MKGPLRMTPFAFVAGLALIFAGERIMAAESAWHWPLVGLGALLVLLAVLLRGFEWARSSGAARAAVTPALLGYLAAGLGLLAYTLTAPSVVDGFGLSEEGAASWRAVWTVIWLLLLVGGAAVGLATDWSRAGLDRPERVEIRRVRAAAAGALSLALATGWLFLGNYVANEQDVFWEWSRTTRPRPSEGTLELVGGLRSEVEIALFFPPASEVLERIRPYFEELRAASGVQIRVEVLDHAVEPVRAKELGVTRNGVVLVAKGDQKKRIELGDDAGKAKRKLKRLDKEVQDALLKVARERRTLYLTVGHGERGAMDKDDPRRGISQLRQVLRRMNVTVKDLGLKEGLGREIPDDVGVIAVIGPKERFLPEETQSLKDWYLAGGSLLLALDPGVDTGLDPLLDAIGVEIPPGAVVNDRQHLRRDGGPGDRVILFTNRFGSHQIVNALAQAGDRARLVFEEAGEVKRKNGTEAKTQVLVRPMLGSYRDMNGNRDRDKPDDPVASESLAMASTSGEGVTESRAVVIGDGDVLADGLLPSPANLRFALEAYVWLTREGESALRVTTPEEDPPLEHTRDQDAAWFWLTVAGVPLLVLGLGLLYVRRRKRRGERHVAGGER